MADLYAESREELAGKFDCPHCPTGGNLSAAPNEKMPNENEYDFRCYCGRLYNISDLMED